MEASPSQAGSDSTPLSSLLAGSVTLPVEAALSLVLELASHLSNLHASGRFHGAALSDSVARHSNGSLVLLSDAPECEVGAGPGGVEWAPPEVISSASCRLPRSRQAAREILLKSGISLDPCQIDVFQLGALLCRLLTGESAAAYMRSPRVKGKVAAEMQVVIERALGCNAQPRFVVAAEFLAALTAARGSLLVLPETTVYDDGRVADDSVPDNAAVSAAANVQEDSTLSFLSGQATSDTWFGRQRIAPDLASPSNQENPGNRKQSAGLPFTRLEHYEIVSRIGHGGMGDVFLGYERALDRKVAIKVLPQELARSEEFVRRFKAEATAAAKLTHPNIVKIYLIGEDQGHHFFAMQFVEGESLADLLQRRGKLAVDETLAIAEQALAGLGAAHRQGLVHRDIKPGNMLLDSEHGRALLADFGLVKSLESSSAGHTATGMVMGTADYISPEQGRGQAVDARSDLYSMGVLLYQVLSGRLPFEADSPTALIFQHVYEQPPPLARVAPEVPAPLAAIVEKLLRKLPADRYQSAEETQADLRAFKAGEPLPSGADRDSSAPASARTPVAPDLARRATTVIQTPQFEELEPLAAGSDKIQVPNLWEEVQGRAQSLFRRHAPEVLKQLQNTQQQIDGAVAEYARRQWKLERLVAEVVDVYGELRRQAESQREAARQAEARAQQVQGATLVHAADSDELRCRQAASELTHQAEEQQEQLDVMRLKLAQVTAKRQQLENQRDILNARLRMAGARGLVGAEPPRRRKLTPRNLLHAVAGIALAVATLIYWKTREEIVPVPARPAAVSAVNAALSGGQLQALTGEIPLELQAAPLQQFRSLELPIVRIGFASKDHRLLAIGGQGNLWSCNTDKFTLGEGSRLQGPAGQEVVQGDFSADGQLLVAACRSSTGTERTIRTFDARTGHLKTTVARGLREVRSVALRADGNMLAATVVVAGTRGIVRLWDVPTGNQLAEIDAPGIDVRTAAFAAQPQEILLGNGSKVTLWGIKQGRGLREFSSAGSKIRAWSVSPDGRGLVTGDEQGQVLLWDVETGQNLGTFWGHNGPIEAIAYSGRQLAAADPKRVLLWNATLGSLRRVLQVEGVTTLAFSEAGLLASAGTASPLAAWDANVAPEPERAAFSHYLSDLNESSGDSTRLIPLDKEQILYAAGKDLGVYSREFRFTSRRFTGHTAPVRSIEVSRDRHQAISGSEDGTVRWWRLDTGAEVRRLTIPTTSRAEQEQVWSLARDPTGDRLLLGTDRGVYLWNPQSGDGVQRLDAPAGDVQDVAWSANGKRVLARGWTRLPAEGNLWIGDPQTGKGEMLPVGRAAPIVDAAFVSDGTQFVYAAGTAVSLCNTADGREVRRFQDKNGLAPTRLAVSPDGRHVAIGGTGQIAIYELATGDLLLHERRSLIADLRPTRLEFSSSGRHLLARGEGNRTYQADVFPALEHDFRSSTPLSVGGNFDWYTELGPVRGRYAPEEVALREKSWRRLRLGIDAGLAFTGPRSERDLIDFRTSGAWGINEGLLVRLPGACRAAMDLGSMKNFEFHSKLALRRTNIVFFLLGWNGRDGHLLWKARGDGDSVWRLATSQQGDFNRLPPTNFGSVAVGDSTEVNVTVKDQKLELVVSGKRLATELPLPAYSGGRFYLGVVDTHSEDLPLRITSFGIKLPWGSMD